MANEREIRRYLRQTARQLPGGGKLKKQILGQLEGSVREYLAENPEADYAGIVARFGKPEDVAETFVNEMDAQELLEAMQTRKKILRIAIAAAAVVILLWAGVVILAYVNNQNSTNGYFVEQIVHVVHEQGMEGE